MTKGPSESFELQMEGVPVVPGNPELVADNTLSLQLSVMRVCGMPVTIKPGSSEYFEWLTAMGYNSASPADEAEEEEEDYPQHEGEVF